MISRIRKNKIRSVTLILTENCNFRCTYCYVHKKNNTMNHETMIDTVQYIKKLMIGTERFSIDIFGGEPMIYSSRVKELIEMLIPINKGYNHPFHVTIFTNGTLFTKSFLEWCDALGFVYFNVSKDGCQECNDKTRVFVNGSGTYDEIESGLSLFENVMGYRTLTKFMISPSNMEYLIESVKDEMSKGITRIPCALVRDDIWTSTDLIKYESILNHLAEFYIENIDNPLWIDLFSIPILDYQYRSYSYCGVGKTMIAIAPDGGIYPCQRFYNMEPSKFKMGDIWKGIDHKEEGSIYFDEYTVPNNFTDCKYCDVFKDFNCMGQCMAAMYLSSKNIFKPIPNICKLLKITYDVSMYVYDFLKTNPNYQDTLDSTKYGG